MITVVREYKLRSFVTLGFVLIAVFTLMQRYEQLQHKNHQVELLSVTAQKAKLTSTRYAKGQNLASKQAHKLVKQVKSLGETPVVNPAAIPSTVQVTGVAGPRGVDGLPGSNGANGLDGIDGTSGTSGTSGVAGAPGVGVPGAVGPPGADGTAGTSGTSGTSGTDGKDGQNGTDGRDAFPFEFTFTDQLGDTYLCTVDDPTHIGSCALS